MPDELFAILLSSSVFFLLFLHLIIFTFLGMLLLSSSEVNTDLLLNFHMNPRIGITSSTLVLLLFYLLVWVKSKFAIFIKESEFMVE